MYLSIPVGQLLIDRQVLEKLSANKKPEVSSHEMKQENRAKEELNFLMNTCDDASDVEKLFFPCMEKESQTVKSEIIEETPSTSVRSRSNYLSSISVCNELSLLLSQRKFGGNVALLSATIYGVPYAFIVSGANNKKNSPCVLDWAYMSIDTQRPPSSSINHEMLKRSPYERKLLHMTIPLPLKWNVAEPLDLPPPHIPLWFDSTFEMNGFLDSIENDTALHQTILLLAKIVIGVGNVCCVGIFLSQSCVVLFSINIMIIAIFFFDGNEYSHFDSLGVTSVAVLFNSCPIKLRPLIV